MLVQSMLHPVVTVWRLMAPEPVKHVVMPVIVPLLTDLRL